MKESYNEGVASHIGPESPVCASHSGRPVCVAAQADALIFREGIAKR